jgi:fibro-slime domain-containing protein
MQRPSARGALQGALVLVTVVAIACGSGSSGGNKFGGGPNPDGGGSGSGGSDGSLLGEVGSFGGDGGSSGGGDGGISGPGTITATIRDFKFYDATDSTTDPDFENPPYNIDQNGNPSPGYMGPWDDHAIVATQLGSDGTPTYAGDATNGTLTTHGNGQPGNAATQFQSWYHDVAGTNLHVTYPLPIVQNADGSLEYDSENQGVLYDPTDATQGKGFFPIDDGTPYQTAFGNQGKPHNYSFTMQIHTVFEYKGGEYFNFRGDDDVYVFINGQLVINLGGVHGPEPAMVQVDSLNLTKGQQYTLDFFSAERHVTGSNILFQTTLGLSTPAQ